MKKLLAGITALVVFITFVAAAAANNPIKLVVNGREITTDVPPQLMSGRTMVPVRWVAQALGAEVRWDGEAVYIDSQSLPSAGVISKQQVAQWIKDQGKNDQDAYYMDGLAYDLVNLDDDAALEVVANIDGGVHLGQFFIFDQDAKGLYQLVTEQAWKVENWDFNNPVELAGKRLFKLVTRTGGTGVDNLTVHLWYLEQGQFIEAWQGILMERVAGSPPETYYQKVGSYQVDADKRLYAWETTQRFDQDGVTPLDELKTTTKIYDFNGTRFTEHG